MRTHKAEHCKTPEIKASRAPFSVDEFKTECLHALGCLGVADLQVSEALVDKIFSLYQASDRYYHDLTHLCSMMSFINLFEDRIENKQELIIAILFHDAIYDSKAMTNEIQSAELAKQTLREAGVPILSIMSIESLILSTQDHQVRTQNFDNMLLLDADLAILAVEEEQYRNYALGIRNEYSWVPDEDYRKGRSAVLEKFLAREHLFLIEENQILLESNARENITKELEELKYAA